MTSYFIGVRGELYQREPIDTHKDAYRMRQSILLTAGVEPEDVILVRALSADKALETVLVWHAQRMWQEEQDGEA